MITVWAAEERHTPEFISSGLSRLTMETREQRGRRNKTGGYMPDISMKNMLEAGVHFGHQTHRWNPKMKPFIFGPRNGIYIIDLEKTVRHMKDACHFLKNVVADGGKVLFVATKKQASVVGREAAERAGMPFVTERWLGGTLTNFQTIRRGVEKLEQLETWKQDGTYEALPKKETVMLERKRKKLESSLGGVRTMRNLPNALFIIDPETERIAVREANRLGIPVAALVDTNCNPDAIDYVIPGNDDALKSVTLFVNLIADACVEGAQLFEQRMRHSGVPTAAASAQAANAEAGEAGEMPVPKSAGPVVERVTRKRLKIPTEIDYREVTEGEDEAPPVEEAAPETPEGGETKH
jgi:small subunit ribosomal protein S2